MDLTGTRVFFLLAAAGLLYLLALASDIKAYTLKQVPSETKDLDRIGNVDFVLVALPFLSFFVSERFRLVAFSAIALSFIVGCTIVVWCRRKNILPRDGRKTESGMNVNGVLFTAFSRASLFILCFGIYAFVTADWSALLH